MDAERKSERVAAIGWSAGAALLWLATATAGLAAPGALNRGNGAEPRTLDPQFVSSVAEENIVGDLMAGLTTEDAGGRPIPGVAERWTTSPDGLTWTFHLRKSLWSDGTAVTSHDFVFAFEHELDPRTAAPFAANLWVLANAQAISAGRMAPSALGVAAPDDATLILTLAHPAPDLPELLLLPAFMPLPTHAVRTNPDGWTRPGTYVSNGPYTLKEWVPNDHIGLLVNPRFYDAAHVQIGAVNYFPAEDSEAALRRFRAGELDIQNTIPSSEIAWLRTNMKGALHLGPYLAVAYVSLNLGDPALKDVRVRKALNLAYDREAVTAKILKLGETPAYGYVPPGVSNYPGGAAMDFKEMPQPARIALAQTLMRDAGYGPSHPLHLVYQTSFNPDSKRIAAVFQAMVQPIFIDLQIQNVDFPVLLRNLKQHQFQLGATEWIADFDDAANFLNLLRSGGANNYGQYKNPKFDALIDAADREPDSAKRAGFLGAAEKVALGDYPWIVTRFPAAQNLVQPKVRGWIDNTRDVHRTRWLWLAK